MNNNTINTFIIIFLLIIIGAFGYTFVQDVQAKGIQQRQKEELLSINQRVSKDLTEIHEMQLCILNTLETKKRCYSADELAAAKQKESDNVLSSKQSTKENNVSTKKQMETKKAEKPTVIIKTITGNSVKMRAEADPKGQVLFYLPKGEKIILTGKTADTGGYDWIQIKDSNGKVGWIVSNYVK